MCTRRPLGACAFSVLLVAGLHHLVRAAEHTGEVTFAGAPVPGVTVTASRGDRRMTTTTNREGCYRFADLDDGPWTIRVEILGFSPVTCEVTIASDAADRVRWELSMLSLDEITSAGTESACLPPAETQRANRAVSDYLLGYYSTNTLADGRLRRVRVTLAGGRQAALGYRESYYANRAFADITTAERERHLAAAFTLQDPITEITLAVEVNYFQLNRAEYFVPVAVKIPGNELTTVRRRGATRTEFVFMGEIRDQFGSLITNIRDALPIRLDTQTAEELASRPVQYDTGFTVLPGEYAIKLLVRDEVTGRIGTYLGAFTVPNLLRETRLPISSVVLSSQRIPLTDALFSVRERVRGTQEASPLVTDNQKLLPSVTRVFSTAREMYVYLEAYQRDVDVMQPLVAFVTFFRDDQMVFETMPVTVAQGRNERSRAVPVAFAISLGGIPTGRYDLQVSILEPGGRRANFWRSPVVLIA